jgi:hypothetical protein
MIRTTIAAGVVAAALGFSNTADAQGFRLSVGVGPQYGYGPSYGYYTPGWNNGGRFYDQRYYGDWRDHRGDWRYHRQPHFHYHAYPFPHYDAHYGRHGHGHRHHDGHRHRH